MFLRHLRLTNIRSVRSLDLDFEVADGGRPWTYILGENGTGKSSVLKSIALVMAGGDAISELLGEPDDWIRLGATTGSIEVEFATADNKRRKAALSFQRGEKNFAFISRNRQDLEALDAAIAKADRNYFVVGYGVTRRAPQDGLASIQSSGPYRSPRAQATATLFSTEAGLVSLEKWAMDLDYRRPEEGLEVIRQCFHVLLPGVDFKRIDKDARRLLFTTEDGELPLAALSDGYQAMAAWCGDLLFRVTEAFQDYANPLLARGLLLVDELDLHLHPVWQRELVRFLKLTLPNMQAVVTTHSPLTVHQAGEGELFLLKRGSKGEGVTLTPFAGVPNKMLLHQLLEHPAFGLQTLDSPQVAEAREELRQLQGGGADEAAQDPGTSARIRELRSEIADVPKWREVPPYMRKTNELLEKIAKKLPGPDDPDEAAAAATRTARES